MPEEADQVFTIKNGEVKETYPSFSFEDNQMFGTKLESRKRRKKQSPDHKSHPVVKTLQDSWF